MIIEAKRLILRHIGQSDFEVLCSILQGPDGMYTYEGAFPDDDVQKWLDRQLARYAQWGWSVGSGAKKPAK